MRSRTQPVQYIRSADLPLFQRLETHKEKPGIDASPACAALAPGKAGHALYGRVALDYFLNIEQRCSMDWNDASCGPSKPPIRVPVSWRGKKPFGTRTSSNPLSTKSRKKRTITSARWRNAAGFCFEKLALWKTKLMSSFSRREPVGRSLGAIQVDFPRTGGREVMGESLQFERCPAPDVYRARQQSLKGDNNVLPPQAFAVRRSRQPRGGSPVHAPRYGVKPTVRDILAPESSRITVTLMPNRIDHKSLRQVALQPV